MTEPTLYAIPPCPSGLAGRVRKMRMREYTEMTETADRGSSADGGMWRILASLWEETLDPGPYPWLQAGPGRIDVSKLLIADANHALIQARVATHGQHHEIPYHCPRCREACVAEIDLLEDLVQKPLPAASADVLRGGGLFTATTLQGKQIKYRLPTVGHAGAVTKLRLDLSRDLKNGRIKHLPARDVADTYAVITEYIEELGDERSRDPRARVRYFWDLDLDEVVHFDAQLSAHDCGFDDFIHHVCNNEACRARNDVPLPFDRSFFKPKLSVDKTSAKRPMTQRTTPTDPTSTTSTRETPQADLPEID